MNMKNDLPCDYLDRFIFILLDDILVYFSVVKEHASGKGSACPTRVSTLCQGFKVRDLLELSGISWLEDLWWRDDSYRGKPEGCS